MSDEIKYTTQSSPSASKATAFEAEPTVVWVHRDDLAKLSAATRQRLEHELTLPLVAVQDGADDRVILASFTSTRDAMVLEDRLKRHDVPAQSTVMSPSGSPMLWFAGALLGAPMVALVGALFLSGALGWGMALLVGAVLSTVVLVLGMGRGLSLQRAATAQRVNDETLLRALRDKEHRVNTQREGWEAIEAVREWSLDDEVPANAQADIWSALDKVSAGLWKGSLTPTEVATQLRNVEPQTADDEHPKAQAALEAIARAKNAAQRAMQ